MADRITYGVESLDRRVTVLSGRLTFTDGSGAFTSDCLGFSVSRTGAGTFRITLEDKWGDNTTAACLFWDAALYADTTRNTYIHRKLTAMSSKQLDFEHVTGGGTTKADPSSADVIRILIVLSNTSAPRKGI